MRVSRVSVSQSELFLQFMISDIISKFAKYFLQLSTFVLWIPLLIFDIINGAMDHFLSFNLLSTRRQPEARQGINYFRFLLWRAKSGLASQPVVTHHNEVTFVIFTVILGGCLLCFCLNIGSYVTVLTS